MEKLSAIIPPPYKHQVNYYGCLSSHSNLRPLIIPRQTAVSKDDAATKNEPPAADENQGGESLDSHKDEKTNKSSYIDWASLLKKVFKIDITVCPKCQGRMKVIAVINEKKIIKKILDHMGLGSDPPVVSPSRCFSQQI